MYKRDIHLHFIGIGGVGMAGIAEVLVNLGYTVSGSDIRHNGLTRHLENIGAKISIGHTADNLLPQTGVVIYSSAVSFENPEIVAAKEQHIPVVSRAEMLAELMRMKYGIAVGGSHGKTTTTSLIAKILTAANLDPTVVIGGRVIDRATGANLGRGEYLVAEADESDGSFCLLRPSIAVVTNIDCEHLTHYGSFGALEQAFLSFMSSVPFYGAVIACFDDPIVAQICQLIQRRVISYALYKEADLTASEVSVGITGSSFDLFAFGQSYHNLRINLQGTHMVSNALAAIAVAYELGVSIEKSIAALEKFPGVARRCEVILKKEGYILLDDYAHHPTEIKSTLTALRKGYIENGKKYQRLVVIFQPHRYSRTKDLFNEFLNCFAAADKVFVTDIYPAGETPIEGINGEILANAIQHSSVTFVKEKEELLTLLPKEISEGDVVVTMGAGSITIIARQLAEILGEQ